MSVEHPVVLVTGAARRVGAEIARELHASGARVALHYRRSKAEAEALAAVISAAIRVPAGFMSGSDNNAGRKKSSIGIGLLSGTGVTRDRSIFLAAWSETTPQTARATKDRNISFIVENNLIHRAGCPVVGT
jgi:NAD(P)-dependent dehydrogenase (short-subunit alcohol dehydrogenase family)